LISEYNLDLVRVQHSTVDHDAVVVEIPHEPCGLEVEYLEGAVLAGSEEPLVVLLKP
jgi:hypothetical protein